MATTTYEPIESKTLATAAAAVTFTNIPAIYTDLVLVCNILTGTGDYLRLRVGNGSIDTGNNYGSNHFVAGPSGPGSYGYANAPWNYIFVEGVTSATNPTSSVTNIMNYANTTMFKTMVTRSGIINTVSETSIGMWRNTGAINQIRIFADTTNMSVGSTFTLYGIGTTGDASPFANGGDVYSDASYWYHVFNLSGNFVPSQSLTADVLVIGGGGSGSWHGPGVPYADTAGGGAGGLRLLTSQSLTAQNYVAQVGAGGSGNGVNGGASLFGSISAAGGGGGGIWVGGAGSAGGSGGGGSGGYSNIGSRLGGAGNTPSTSPSQGNNGGNGFDGGQTPSGGGGGGAGGAGSNSSNATGGNGGIGYFDTFTNAIGALASVGQLSSGNYYFAGGGGGATRGATQGIGGLGGGTNGAGLDGTAGTSANALVNSGGGSGGGSYVGNGGSGLIVVRYAK